MPVDHIRYDILVQDALRGMVRNVLTDAAKNGLIGDHHFFITFDTTAEGVQLSERLRQQYPEEMRIVLQHQFWGLKVTDDALEVGLSFSGIAEKLVIPFEAIKIFDDPSVQFKLQFETLAEADEDEQETGEPLKTVTPPQSAGAPEPARNDASAPSSDPASLENEPGEPGERSGAEVVRLDRFRKK